MKASFRSVLKKPVQFILNANGYEIASKGSVRNWRNRIRELSNRGFSPQLVIDGGAFRGNWAKEVADIFPAAKLVLIEPNPYLQETIKNSVVDIRPEPLILECALADKVGVASLNFWRDTQNDSSASLLDHVQGVANQSIQVRVDTIDNITDTFGLVPSLIKLDLQGGELSALKGGRKALQHAEVVVVEFHCLEAYLGRPSPRDILDYMYDNNFKLYDIFDCYNRPYDNALAGGDLLFVKNASELLVYQGWK